ncbi:MAG: HWE histidine kinase domain-containing protein [Caulobacteraceae bacterium]
MADGADNDGAISPRALLESTDWSKTPLGPRANWPASLASIVSVVMNHPLPMVVRWGRDLVQIYNSAYSELIGDRHPKAFAETMAQTWPDAAQQYTGFYDAVFRGEAVSIERQFAPPMWRGRTEASWFDIYYSPILDDTGAVGGALVTTVEATREVEQKQAADALEAETGRLRSLMERAPGFMGVVRGPNHVFEFMNEAMARLLGQDRRILGRPLVDALPEVERQGFIDLLDRVYSSGEPYIGESVGVYLQRRAGGPPDLFFVDVVYEPTYGADGEINGVFMVGHDITEHIRDQQKQALLVRELNHRVKNTLAVVLAIARLALKTAKTLDEFAQSFDDRVQSLANTHDLLTANLWQPVEVKSVLEAELAPFSAAASDIQIECDRVRVAASDAVNLTLIIHELATNAAKYGALSVPDGRLRVVCHRTDISEAQISWVEASSRPIDERLEVKGFGTRLMQRLARDLGGEAEIGYAPDGFEARLCFRVELG